MDIDRCLKVLKVPTGAYRCLQVGTGGHRWAPVGTGGRCLVIFKSANNFLTGLLLYH